MRRFGMARATFALACIAMVGGCSAILGDFSVGATSTADGGTPSEDSGNVTTGDGNVNVDGSKPSDDGGGADTSVPPGDDGSSPIDAAPDVVELPDVGPAGNPGVAITAGGTFSKSAHYHVVGALGESPGGNLTMSSANYKLTSGVIGATQ